MEKVYSSIKGIINERLGDVGAEKATANQPKLSLMDRVRKGMGIPAGGTSPYAAPAAKPQAVATPPAAKPQAAMSPPAAKPQATASKVNDGPNANIDSSTRDKALASVSNLPKRELRTDAEIKASKDLGSENPEGGEKRTDAEIKASADLADAPPLKKKEDNKANTSTMQMASYDMTINKKFSISDALYNSVMEVMNKDKKEGSIPRNEKEKDLAAFHGDPKRITHGDVLKARGVTKEEAELIDELSKSTLGSYIKKAAADSTISRKIGADFENRANSKRSPAMKDASTALSDKFKSDSRKRKANVDKAVDRLTKEEAESVEEMSSKMKMKLGLYGKKKKTNEESVDEGMGSAAKSMAKKVLNKLGGGSDEDQLKNLQKKMGVPQTGKKPVKENKDTPGNSYEHQCAIHVKSESFGEGRTITTQHAEPDADGNIAWYDIMFEHGIEKQVPTTTLEILVSEMHMHSKKKKAM
jgi:hypothetical protein